MRGDEASTDLERRRLVSYFDLKTNEVNSFDGRFYRFTTIAGPIELVRFSDSRAGSAGRYGRFWLYGSEVVEMLQSASAGFHLIKQISKRWAICDDWGDKQLAWKMVIPRGMNIPAAWGRAKFQPKVSTKSQGQPVIGTNGQIREWRETVRSYPGGSLQIIIPVTDENGRINCSLAGLIKGPQYSQTLNF
jgi:hypothetical protein